MITSRFQNNRGKAKGLKTSVSNTVAYPYGFDTYTANDLLQEKLRYVTDARLTKLGQYRTRKGMDFYSTPAGEASDQSEASATGAADQAVTNSTRYAQGFTCGTTGRLTKLTLSVKNSNSGTAPLRVDIYDDDSGAPGAKLAQSSIADTDITASYTDVVARFSDAPSLTATNDYWIVVYQQDNASGDYLLESTTNSTDALKSTDSGSSWSAQSFSLLFETFMSTNNPTIGAFRAYKSDGTKKTLMAHGTTLSSVNDGTGALTSVSTGRSASATRYRFAKINDVVYYVNGYDAPRKWDFSTDAAMGGSPATSSNITIHKDKIFFVETADPNKIFWSNDAGDYETFTSTDFIYVPSPKHSFPITALESFNDVLFVFTDNDKWALYGDDLANFELSKAPGSKGAFAQEAVASNRNHIYFASDDGVYRFNGTSDELISAPVTDIYEDIADKSKVTISINGNRLYVFYPSAGASDNDRVLVFNIDHEAWESIDLDVPVSLAISFSAASDNNEFVVFSNRVGAGCKYGQSSNNFSDMGKPLTFELRTKYDQDRAPQAKKLLKRLYPRFQKESNSYNVSVEVDRDFADSPSTASTVSLETTGATWGGGAEWGDGTTWGSAQLIKPRVSIPGQSEYAQIRYKRVGVNTPVNFINHTRYIKDKRGV